MVLETLRRGLSKLRSERIKLPEPSPAVPPLTIVPMDFDRRGVLLCLVDRLNFMPRRLVVDLAEALYQDARKQRIRPVSEVYRQIATAPWWRHGLLKSLPDILNDPVLQKSALSYSIEDMEQKCPPEAASRAYHSPSDTEAIAGSGPARPLIADLCSMYPSMIMVDTGEGFHNDEHFIITQDGRGFAAAIRSSYERFDWRIFGNMVVARSASEPFSRP